MAPPPDRAAALLPRRVGPRPPPRLARRRPDPPRTGGPPPPDRLRDPFLPRRSGRGRSPPPARKLRHTADRAAPVSVLVRRERGRARPAQEGRLEGRAGDRRADPLAGRSRDRPCRPPSCGATLSGPLYEARNRRWWWKTGSERRSCST